MPIVAIKRGTQASSIRSQSASDWSHVSPRARSRPTPAGLPPVVDNAPDAVASPKRAHHKVDRIGPNWDEDGNYIVGWKRPPLGSRWGPGQSGNPGGPKPKEKLDPMEAFDKEMLDPFVTTVNGKPQTLTNLSLSIQSLKKAAAQGNVKAADLLLKYSFASIDRTVAREGTPEIEAWEQATIDEMLDQLGLPARPVVRNTDRSIGEDDPQ